MVENGSLMWNYKKKIVITGDTSRFAKTLKKFFNGKNIKYLNKKEFNILNFRQIDKYLKKRKIKVLIHMAGLSRPLVDHDVEINKSIDLNIIGTCNVVKACKNNNIKLIFFSTSYVYPGNKNYSSEKDSLLPFNNYGWSKLGAESAVHMYKNSLILRLSITEKPFLHKYAFTNVKSNFMFHDDFAKVFHKLINKKGIINVGNKSTTVFDFAKKNNPNVLKKRLNSKFTKQDMDVNKFFKIIKQTS